MKYLNIDLKGATPEQMELIEGSLIENPLSGFEYDLDQEKANLMFALTTPTKDITFHSFMEPGKWAKEMLLSNGLISDTKDNARFSLREIDAVISNNNVGSADLDKHIRSVPKDDPIVMAALGKLSKLKK